MIGRARDWLIGRENELRAVDRAFEAARHGEAALLIQGEPGIGKSALASVLVEEAPAAGFAVLRCRPAESETSYAHAALGDLVGGLLDELGPELPEPQRRSLELALYRSGDAAPGTVTPAIVAAATANLLAAAASRGPVCIVVDDVQWLDSPTEQALRFALRRLSGPGMLVAVLRRGTPFEGGDPLGLRAALGDGRLTEIELTRLSVGALHALLHRELGLALSRTRLLQVHASTRGNPLFALEIGRAIVARGGRLAPEAPLPLPESLTQALSARIAAAPPAVEHVLQVVATSDRPDFATLTAVLGSRQAAEQALDAARSSGMVEVESGRIRPAHPLLASVAASRIAPDRHRQLHRKLAAAEPRIESRARHLALASEGPDEAVAAALAHAAQAARARGATDTAAELLGMAVDRTPAASGQLSARKLLLCQALLDAGDLAAAREAADELLRATLPPDARGEVSLLRATAAWYLETSADAVGYLEEALKAEIKDRLLLGRIHMHLAVFSDFDAHKAGGHARQAVRLLEAADDNDPASAGALATSLCQQFLSEVYIGMAPRQELLERALAIEPAGGQFERSTVPGIWWTACDRYDDAGRRFREMLELARQVGDRSGEADLLTRLAEVALASGAWQEAAELANEATAVAQQEGQEHADPARRVRAMVAAHVGDLEAAEEAAGGALARLEQAGDHILAAAWLVVSVLVAVTRADAKRVAELTARSAAHLEAIGIVEALRIDVAAERAAALCSLERMDEATEVLARLEARQRRIPRPSLAAGICRARAQLASATGQLPESVAETDVALSDAAHAWPDFERGRALLLRGQLLRRARQRRGSREALEAALLVFERLGARAWAQITEGELRRLGRYRPGTEELTPAEREVALLVASGLPTREVAARLFISPKTAEAHLTHIYAKLGISSRAQLGALMSEAMQD